jgi:hypothetical protein
MTRQRLVLGCSKTTITAPPSPCLILTLPTWPGRREQLGRKCEPAHHRSPIPSINRTDFLVQRYRWKPALDTTSPHNQRRTPSSFPNLIKISCSINQRHSITTNPEGITICPIVPPQGGERIHTRVSIYILQL